MDSSSRRASVIALAALVSLLSQAPTDARVVSSRPAAADDVEQRATEDTSGGPTQQPWNAVVRGDRTGIGPTARAARSNSLSPVSAWQKDEGDRTGIGPKAVEGRSFTGVPNVAH